MENIINIIKEEILKHSIEETHKSVNEINKLANDILSHVAKENYDFYNKDGEFKYLYGTHILGVNPDNFDEIKDFMENMNLMVSFSPNRGTIKRQGDYGVLQNRGKNFNPKSERDINLYYNYDELKEKIDNQIKNYGKLDSSDVYFILYYLFHSSLAHELQHAYDDYRSKGRTFDTKQNKEYLNKYHNQGQNAHSKEMKKDLEHAKKYLNLPHEIWARFTQAIDKIGFYSTDFSDDMKVQYHTMYPLKGIVKEFMYDFKNFNVLSQKSKKILIRKVSQFWHLEKDKIDKENSELTK